MIWIIQFACCLYMTGVIWVIQLVHYPSFQRIERVRFAEFSRFHSRRMTWVVMPAMLLELGTGIWICVQGPAAFNLINLTGIVLIWGCTFGLSVPCHNRLAEGYDEETVRRLIRTNWPRTILWSVRSAALPFAVVLATV